MATEIDDMHKTLRQLQGQVASLRDELRLERQRLRETVQTPELLVVQDRAIEQLRTSGLEERSLQVGQRAPDFRLRDAEDIVFDSSAHRHTGPLVVAFLRGSWCPFCDLAMRRLEETSPRLSELGATLVGLSPERPQTLGEWRRDNHVTFPLLSDRDNRIAARFGIVWRLPDYLRELYEEHFELFLSRYNGDSGDQLPVPATYVIDRDGSVLHRFVDPDYSRRMEPADILRVLENCNTR